LSPAPPAVPTSQPPAAPAIAPRPDVNAPASFIGVFGAPGSGKSTVIKKLLAQLGAPRLIIFDPGHEYENAPHHVREAEFYEALNNGATWLTLRPSFDIELRARQFDRFCQAALAIARAKGSCAVVVDELHRVTAAGYAPEHWRELVETGRKFGVTAIAASIRPASIDKGFWSVATSVRAGRLNYTEDQKTLANVLNVPITDMQALTGYQWIQRNMLDGSSTRG
jgi:AAA domain